MPINNKSDFYLKDDKLDFSILDEGISQKIQEQDGHSDILQELEAIEVSNMDITSTLKEMAMIFEEEDELREKEELSKKD